MPLPERSERHSRRPLVLLLAATALPMAAAEPPLKVTFDAPFVTNLSAARRWTFPTDRPRVAAVALSAEQAQDILGAPAVSPAGPDQLGRDPGTGGAAPDEAALINADDRTIRRQDRRLIIQPKAGRGLLFLDASRPAAKDAEGDSVTYRYAGRVGKAHLYRVEVAFGHDAPGSFLVGPEGGQVAFVHDGGDVAVLAPGGERLVLFNDLNPPLTVVVASLTGEGTSDELVCRVGGKGRARIELKGWRGPDTVDLVLGLGEKGGEKVPVRLERSSGGWRVAAPEPRRLAAPDGFSCLVGPVSPGTR